MFVLLHGVVERQQGKVKCVRIVVKSSGQTGEVMCVRIVV